MNLTGNFAKAGIFMLILTFISFDLPAQDKADTLLPQFLFPRFTEGIIIMKDGKKFSSMLNYDMADERMISKLNGVYRSANDTYNFDSIYIQNRTFIPVGKAFYELLVNGPATFLLENKVYITPKGSDVGYGVKNRSIPPTETKRFELSSVKFNEVVTIDLPPDVEISPASVNWVRKDNKLEKFNNQKQLIKIFPGKEAELKAFIKREKINFGVRKDIIRLGKYCNELK